MSREPPAHFRYPLPEERVTVGSSDRRPAEPSTFTPRSDYGAKLTDPVFDRLRAHGYNNEQLESMLTMLMRQPNPPTAEGVAAAFTKVADIAEDQKRKL